MLFLSLQETVRQSEAENAALREAINQKDMESQKHLSTLDAKLMELENLKKNLGMLAGLFGQASSVLDMTKQASKHTEVLLEVLQLH